jgi:multimeric flavodoxin WrbA
MVKVRILGIAGSPRHGNTEIIVKEALKAAKELPDVETEFVSLADAKIEGGCKGEYACWKISKEELAKRLCLTYKDDLNSILRKMMDADGIIVGSPVYWGSVPAQLKNLIDRSMPLEIANMALRNKVGGVLAVAVDRHGGHEGTVADILRWFILMDMIICGVGPEFEGRTPAGGAMALQGFPKPVMSLQPGERSAVLQDKSGLTSVRYLGRRVTELAKIVKAGIAGIEEKELAWPKVFKFK